MPLNDAAEATVGERRLAMSLLSLFGLVSLAPAGFGVYAVMSYLVSQQIRDLGVRIALGARSLDLLATVLTDTAGAVFLGTAAGLAASAAIAVAMRRLLFGVAPLDGVTFAAAPAMLMLVAIVAALLPARRATRVDPLVALKKT
jgi:ABC-type antimicrobial peptide transport system permease subunit